MNMLPTLQLWSLLRHEFIPAEFRSLLRIEEKNISSSWRGILSSIALLLSMTVFLLPLIINLICLQKTTQVSKVIAKHGQLGWHDLLKVTPVGDMGRIFGVAQAYFRPITCSVNVLAKFWITATVGTFLFFLLMRGNLSEGLQFMLDVSVIVAALIMDYMQSVIWAMVVSVFAGMTVSGSKAQIFAVSAYWILQVALYGALLAALRISFYELRWYVTPLQLNLVLGIILALFFIIREGAIAALWFLIRKRINDELPALKVKAKQG